MENSIALAVLEISAVLLTLLFIGIQYLSRQLMAENVATDLLQQTARIISNAAVLLVVATFLSAWHLDIVTNSVLITFVLSTLILAFIAIGYGIHAVAKGIGNQFDGQEVGGNSTNTPNTEGSKESLKETKE